MTGAAGRLVVLTGPPGAGKSTVAAVLVESYRPSVHVHADDFWHFLRRGALPPYRADAHEQNRVVVTALARAAAAYAAGGYTVITDGVIGPWFLETFCAEANRPVDYVVLRPDEETAVRRAVLRGDDALTDPVLIRSMYAQFAELGAYERNVIDTTTDAPDITAERVRKALLSGNYLLRPTSG